jgi:NAD(P)-dependent dehydrogenase (short-subunit alcohol dehydrogenase family)
MMPRWPGFDGGKGETMRFKGKSAVVTGASEGIGFAIAAALVREGARVVLVARREDRLADAVRQIGPGAFPVVGDAGDAACAERAVATAVSRHGGLDLLVNNAGVLLPGFMGKQSNEDVDRMLATNLRGTILFTQAAVGPMTGRPGAAMLLISSSAVREPVPGTTVYGATKAAQVYLAKAWAIELAPAGIRVNALCPGPTDTPAMRAADQVIPGLIDMNISTSLSKRIASSEEIAEIALTLLDDQKSSFVTGSVWDVDGGYRLG